MKLKLFDNALIIGAYDEEFSFYYVLTRGSVIVKLPSRSVDEYFHAYGLNLS